MCGTISIGSEASDGAAGEPMGPFLACVIAADDPLAAIAAPSRHGLYGIASRSAAGSTASPSTPRVIATDAAQ